MITSELIKKRNNLVICRNSSKTLITKMRSFQILTLVLFLVFFLLTLAGSLFNLKKITGGNKFASGAFILLNVLVLAGFILLYIYPFSPRTATNYPVYFFYNTFLFAVFLFNVPMAFAQLTQLALIKWLKKPVITYTGFIIALALSAGMIFGTFAGSRQIKTTSVDLVFPNLPADFNNYKIIQLSDFHLGGMLNPEKLLTRTRKKLNQIQPDLILFTGDMVNNFALEVTGFDGTLQNISKIAPTYSILGNHDYGDYTNWESTQKKQANFETIIKAQTDAGFQLLNNDFVVLRNGSDSIFLAGVENWGHPPFPQYADLEKAIRNIPEEAFMILMTHDPAHWESKITGKENIELTLSGHTHGLQWGIKFAGIPFSLAWFTRQHWGGLYQNNNSVLYVNTGLGTVGMPWRLDMPGEITVFTLKRGEVD